MKKILALLCTMMLLLGILSAAVSAAPSTTAKGSLITTNIPKSFPAVKQEASATVVNFWHAMSDKNALLVDNLCNWFNATTGKQQKIY